jgi:ABC-2 type transport system permease protein
MTKLLVLTGREWRAHAYAPGTWILLGLAWFWIAAMYCWQVLPTTGHGDLQYMLWQVSLHTANLQILFVPMLTMRTIAEERRTGTLEMLATAPIRDHEIILAKFLGALAVAGIMTLIVPFLLVLAVFAGGEPDWGPVLSASIALLGTAAVLTAIGVLASSLTHNQLLAGFLGLILSFGFMYLPRVVPADWETLQEVVASGDLLQQVEESARGLIDLTNISFQLGMTALFLFFATRSLETRKWI